MNKRICYQRWYLLTLSNELLSSHSLFLVRVPWAQHIYNLERSVFPFISNLGKCHLCSYSFQHYLTPRVLFICCCGKEDIATVFRLMVIFLHCFLGMELFHHLPSIMSPVGTIWIPNSNRILSYVSLDFKQGYFYTVDWKKNIERTCIKTFNNKKIISNLILNNQTKLLNNVTVTIERSYIVQRHFTSHLKIVSCLVFVWFGVFFNCFFFQWDLRSFLTHNTYVLLFSCCSKSGYAPECIHIIIKKNVIWRSLLRQSLKSNY